MEAFSYTRDSHSMNKQNYQFLFKKAIQRIDQTEKILHDRVQKEIQTIIIKHVQIQKELNK